jgi:phage terminase small subunit
MLLRRSLPARTADAALPSDRPSFTGLDEREALFVVEYVARAGLAGAGADAALAAGYSNGNRNGAHSMASRLLRRPHVLRAIKDETAGRLARSAPIGVAVLEDLARSARSEQVRLAAANSLIDRGYGPVVSRSANANLNVNAGIEELLDRVERQERRPPPVDVTPKAE